MLVGATEPNCLARVRSVRTVFAFPAGKRAETIALLDRLLNQQRHPWTLDGNLYINIDDEQTGHLFIDW